METKPLNLPWGKDQMDLELPANWRIQGIFSPKNLEPVADPAGEVRRSLAEPFGSRRLNDLAHPGMRVALVIDDGSRPTPVAKILPAVLEVLHQAGVEKDCLTIVPAIGLHRAMPDEEVAERTGLAGLDGYRVENPDCDDPQKLSFLGTTRFGTPVWVNRTVAEAELIVSIGCIEPHIIASFGGGYKNLFPGVAGRATVAHNHSLNCTPATFNMVGQPIDHNPMRQDLEEAGRMLKAPVFIINAILDNAQRLVRVVAGDAVAAHRAGVEVSAALYGVEIPAPADVVITASHPMDQDLRQGVKALANTVRAVKKGGVLITFVRAEEGVGVFGLANKKLPLGKKALRLLAPLLVGLVPKLKLKGMGEEDRFFLYFALQAMQHAQLLMVAPTIPAETKDHLPFVDFADTPAQAIEMARARFPQGADVLVFPHGGITYPILQDNQ